MRQRGRPPSDNVTALQARAWFNFVAKVAAGAIEVGSSVQPVSAMRLCEATLDGDHRMAFKWAAGDFVPSVRTRKEIYVGLNFTKAQAESAEYVVLTGPDGFPLWSILRGMHGEMGEFPVDQTEYFQNTFHIYQELITELLDWLQIDKAVCSLPEFMQPNARMSHRPVAINRGMVMAATNHLGWYGLNWDEVLEILCEKIPVMVQKDTTEAELNAAMDALDASQLDFD